MQESKLSKLARYYHTVKYLKPRQLYGQLYFRIKKAKINDSPSPRQRQLFTNFVKPLHKFAQLESHDKIIFLNKSGNISSPTIWNDTQFEKLWLYNLHYFDVLNSLENNSSFAKNFIKRWINENPPAEGYGWVPYTISLRMVNWIKWVLAGNEIEVSILNSLAQQTRYLMKRIEIHILANHILANAKALLFSGLFFSGSEAEKWFKKGLKLFNAELNEQILSDGGHFELSPMYQATVLEDLLDVINLFKTYGQNIPPQWMTTCDKMFLWLETMCHTDGEIAFFNDATLNIAPHLQVLKEYKNRLHLKKNVINLTGLTYLTDSGYCRIQHKNALLLLDIAEIGANYQPGHAHADTLSFELSINSKRLFVNSGISTYAENAERVRQRSTSAHNTLKINDINSTEVWRSFRVARRAQIKNIQISHSDKEFFVSASHDGFYRVNKIIHTRLWHLLNNRLMIEDQVNGKGKHTIELNFHVHPEILVNQQDDYSILFSNQNILLAKLISDHELKIEDSTYHPGFNISIPNKKIIISALKELPTKFKTYLLIQDE